MRPRNREDRPRSAPQYRKVLLLLPTKPGPGGWISAYPLSNRLGTSPYVARQVLYFMEKRGLVERGGLNPARHRLYRITAKGLLELRQEMAPKDPPPRAGLAAMNSQGGRP